MALPDAQVLTHAPLLGTVVEIQVSLAPGTVPAVAAAADAAAVAEFERLNLVFSTHRSDSELARWSRGETQACSPDLLAVLAAAEYWYSAGGGAFHAATGRLTAAWRAAEASGVLPSDGELVALGAGAPLPFRIRNGVAERLGDCSGMDLNAIAKGYLVDRALAAAAEVAGVTAVVVNAGGDLHHAGAGSIMVGLEDPARPYDNLPPRWRVRLANAALATSGSSRRGFQVGARRLGHVLDPRTGRPVGHTAAVSVLAADAVTADALATILGVLEPEAALRFAEAQQVACLVVTADGRTLPSRAWPSIS